MPDQNVQKQEAAAPAEVERTEDTPTFLPRVDIIETEQQLEVTADMPGVDQDSVSVDLEGKVLTIRGKYRLEAPEGYSLVYQEYRSGSYERAFTVGEQIDREKIEATVRNGVLRLVLPKAKEAQPRRITVRAG